MGQLVEGEWTSSQASTDDDGRFRRSTTAFRDWIRADGSGEFAPDEGRYHLYASYACPWAHRALITRAIAGLEDVISVSIVHPFMGEDGWSFDEAPGTVPDPIHDADFLREIYVHAASDYTGRVTVPVLWDRDRGTVVNNESKEIVRMFDVEFGEFGEHDIDLYPEELREEIDETIEAIYQPINNGVYRVGFAGTQEAYDEAVAELFGALDHWDEVLGRQRYLCGARFTEADICMFTTLYRFDAVYHTHFKCNTRRLPDYPNLWGYAREIYQMPGVSETCRMDHVRHHYYRSHESLNPKRIVASEPRMDWDDPHGREEFEGRPPRSG